MMYSGLNCVCESMKVGVRWVRKHNDADTEGSEDYFAVAISDGPSDFTLFLSPAQLDELADKLSKAGQDRYVTLWEKASGLSLTETGGGG